MFYLMDIETYIDGTKDNIAVYTFNARTDGLASFHARLGSAMKNSNCKTALLVLVTASGNVVAKEFFERAVSR